MEVGARASEIFGEYYCAEAVLQALAEHQGIESDVIPKIASGFCSGFARTCGPCGAVTGAVMGLGLALGRSKPSDTDESKKEMVRCYVLSQELINVFTERFGSSNCLELTGCDLMTPEGQKKFQDEKVIDRCAVFVEEAARMAVRVLGDT